MQLENLMLKNEQSAKGCQDFIIFTLIMLMKKFIAKFYRN